MECRAQGVLLVSVMRPRVWGGHWTHVTEKEGASGLGDPFSQQAGSPWGVFGPEHGGLVRPRILGRSRGAAHGTSSYRHTWGVHVCAHVHVCVLIAALLLMDEIVGNALMLANGKKHSDHTTGQDTTQPLKRSGSAPTREEECPGLAAERKHSRSHNIFLPQSYLYKNHSVCICVGKLWKDTH